MSKSLFFVSPHNWYDHVSKNKINRPMKLANQFSQDRFFEKIYIVNRIRPDRLYSSDSKRELVESGIGYKVFRCENYDNTYYLEHCFPFGIVENSMLPKILKTIISNKKMSDTVIIVADPKSTAILKYRLGLGIFDAYDDWTLSPMYKDNPRQYEALKKGYELGIRYSDSILVNTTYMKERMDRASGNISIVTNTSSLLNEIAAGQTKEVLEKKEQHDNVIGYIGNIYERLDLELIEYTVANNPNSLFKFIGKETWGLNEGKVRFNNLLTYPNFIHIDHVPYHEVKMNIETFTVCIIPHIVDEFTLTQDSMKMYDFLSIGKPVVCTPIPPSDLLSDYVYIANDKEEFNKYINCAITEDISERSKERIELMKSNQWDSKAKQIYDIIEELSVKEVLV